MTQWHLGNRAEAHKLYEQTVAWAEENYPHHPKLEAYRAEAAELLGIEPYSEYRSLVIAESGRGFSAEIWDAIVSDRLSDGTESGQRRRF